VKQEQEAQLEKFQSSDQMKSLMKALSMNNAQLDQIRVAMQQELTPIIERQVRSELEAIMKKKMQI
jgi:hypothetical protein